MDFVLPPLLWLGVGKRSIGFRILNWAIVIGYSGIAIAGAHLADSTASIKVFSCLCIRVAASSSLRCIKSHARICRESHRV